MFSADGMVDNSKSGNCAILGCKEITNMQCPQCRKHYCYLHVKDHVHRLEGEDLEEGANDLEKL